MSKSGSTTKTEDATLAGMNVKWHEPGNFKITFVHGIRPRHVLVQAKQVILAERDYVFEDQHEQPCYIVPRQRVHCIHALRHSVTETD